MGKVCGASLLSFLLCLALIPRVGVAQTSNGQQPPKDVTGQTAPGRVDNVPALKPTLTRYATPPPLDGYQLPAPTYDGWVRKSQYVTVRDGTKLALDLYLPTRHGVAAGPLPVLLKATPYRRVPYSDGKYGTELDDPKALPRMALERGYVIAVLDVRGHGASFGEGRMYSATEREVFDLHDVIQWIAAQPQTDGKIGMYGCSSPGLLQFMAAASMPQALKSIVPTGGPFDDWAVTDARVNGMRNTFFDESFKPYMLGLDITHPGPPVDEDAGGVELAKAVEDHRRAWESNLFDYHTWLTQTPFRDSIPKDPQFQTPLVARYGYFGNIRSSEVSVLTIGGWFDRFADDNLRAFETLRKAGTRVKAVYGPWSHCEWEHSENARGAEVTIRWYDHELKGVQTGVDRAPTMQYFVMGAPSGHEWRSASQWPLPNQHSTAFYLDASRSGTVKSMNDGRLTEAAPSAGAGNTERAADYAATTTGIDLRFNTATSDGSAKNLDLSPLHPHAFTYTSAPFPKGVEITGSPVVTLYASSSATNQDFYFYVEAVDPKGHSVLMSDGGLRASNRALRTPPYENFGLPWIGSFEKDQRALVAGQPVKLELALVATSFCVKPGGRVRLTITNIDKGNFDTPILDPAPKVTLYHNRTQPSMLSLPTINAPSAGDNPCSRA